MMIHEMYDNKPLPPYCNIHAYCLMTNHIHLLIAEGAEPLANTMKRIGVAYVSYFNKRHDRLGPLFHDRFRSEPVAKAAYFITLLRYIHCNPVEAGIVDAPGKYQWSVGTSTTAVSRPTAFVATNYHSHA